MELTIATALKFAGDKLQLSSNSPAIDGRVLLAHVLKKETSYLYTWPEKPLTAKEHKLFLSYLERREKGEPVAYIIGEREFWSLSLQVSPATLIPRPETEQLVEYILDNFSLDDNLKILDLGTGTGAIALALASEAPNWHITGVDLQDDAVKLAKSNQNRLKLTNCEFKQGSWFSNCDLDNKYHIIVSNPPYIDKDDPHLLQGDVRFEPNSALIAAQNGLADIKIIAQQANNYLENNGSLIFEHGADQGILVQNILKENSYLKLKLVKDYANLDRISIGTYIKGE